MNKYKIGDGKIIDPSGKVVTLEESVRDLNSLIEECVKRDNFITESRKSHTDMEINLLTSERRLRFALEANQATIDYFSPMEFSTCCSGRDCGCMGMPTGPEYYILQKLKSGREDGYKTEGELMLEEVTEELKLIREISASSEETKSVLRRVSALVVKLTK